MKKRRSKKLILSKETLRSLVGGDSPISYYPTACKATCAFCTDACPEPPSGYQTICDCPPLI